MDPIAATQAEGELVFAFSNNSLYKIFHAKSYTERVLLYKTFYTVIFRVSVVSVFLYLSWPVVPYPGHNIGFSGII